MSRTKRPDRKKHPLSRKAIMISLILTLIIVLISLSSYSILRSTSRFPLKAAIIDQLGQHFQNETFIETVTAMLKNADFAVTYYGSESVTVALYKELAALDYGIIILRAHFAMRNDSSTVDMFTSQPFNSTIYAEEMRLGLLSEGRYTFENTSYFAVAAKFVEEMPGAFPRSIIIAMGCSSVQPGRDQMAHAFHEKGAEVYIGWSNVILSNDTDDETTSLLDMLLNQNKTIAEAVSQTKPYTYKTEVGVVESRMTFYPLEASGLTLSQMTGNAKTQTSPLLLAFQVGAKPFHPISTARVREEIPEKLALTLWLVPSNPLKKADS